MIEVSRESAIEGKIALRIRRNSGSKRVVIGEDEEYPNRNACRKESGKDQQPRVSKDNSAPVKEIVMLTFKSSG